MNLPAAATQLGSFTMSRAPPRGAQALPLSNKGCCGLPLERLRGGFPGDPEERGYKSGQSRAQGSDGSGRSQQGFKGYRYTGGEYREGPNCEKAATLGCVCPRRSRRGGAGRAARAPPAALQQPHCMVALSRIAQIAAGQVYMYQPATCSTISTPISNMMMSSERSLFLSSRTSRTNLALASMGPSWAGGGGEGRCTGRGEGGVPGPQAGACCPARTQHKAVAASACRGGLPWP
jgi:hypothetical protein